MNSDQDAEGWYDDPYHAHQHRWFSAGSPTSLVRDGGVESKDAPPNKLMTATLVRAVNDSGTAADGSDLRRADDKQGGQYDPDKAWDAAIDAATTWGPVN